MTRVRPQHLKSQTVPTTPTEIGSTMDAAAVSVAMIQALIPLGLRAVEEALQAEVTALAGARYAHDDDRAGVVRWGKQRGSVFLADQKLAIDVPRVRDQRSAQEVPLPTYQALQQPRNADVGLFGRVLCGLSCRNYQQAVEAVPEAFGLTPSSISRRFRRVSARELQRVQERPLNDAHWLVLMLDGKTFADDALVIALGVTTTGEKRILGLVQTATENKRVCAAFLRELVERGFQADAGLLVVLDGAKGLRAAVRDVFPTQAIVQRCQWHKRENVVAYLPPAEQDTWRRQLAAAYAKPTYAAAKAALLRLHAKLQLRNQSAAASLLEGLEETLTLHQLGVFAELGRAFKTTNPIESVMARVEERTGRVDHWRTSDQKLRWCGAALLAVEASFRRVKGFEHLPQLAKALSLRIIHLSQDAA